MNLSCYHCCCGKCSSLYCCGIAVETMERCEEEEEVTHSILLRVRAHVEQPVAAAAVATISDGHLSHRCYLDGLL